MNQLFDVYFVAEHCAGTSQVVFSLPISPASVLTRYPGLLKFCFPEPAPDPTLLHYTFALTDGEGEWTFGHCGRWLVSTAITCHCLITRHPWFALFRTLLTALPTAAVFFDLLQRPLPLPKMPYQLPCGTALHRPVDTLFFPTARIHLLFERFGIPGVLVLCGCLLEERRVLLCGADLGIVSDCIYALAALLDPFKWKAVLIPLLPTDMVDVLCAPMPFLIGTHPDTVIKAQHLPCEQIVVADVATGNYVGADALEDLPGSRSLSTNLKLALKRERGDPAALDHSLRLCFADFFVSIFGKYVLYLNHTDCGLVWDEAAFMSYLQAKNTRMFKFAERVRETQYYDFWKQSILETDLNTGRGLFLERCAVKHPALFLQTKASWWEGLLQRKRPTSLEEEPILNATLELSFDSESEQLPSPSSVGEIDLLNFGDPSLPTQRIAPPKGTFVTDLLFTHPTLDPTQPAVATDLFDFTAAPMSTAPQPNKESTTEPDVVENTSSEFLEALLNHKPAPQPTNTIALIDELFAPPTNALFDPFALTLSSQSPHCNSQSTNISYSAAPIQPTANTLRNNFLESDIRSMFEF
eukprot:NODE_717_length_1921_cov_43.506689_g665_i0.p1 GENE.NODE_717_length_1921_cov_43.506689_g665_i0~~NODE_717_length_1921_cov_43.506689_g665_i0.p1  ORF type:complete len:582 (-),score=139.56 NODE_717_length_1921_cov_43.506689_g665_i0:107-1852(-)